MEKVGIDVVKEGAVVTDDQQRVLVSGLLFLISHPVKASVDPGHLGAQQFHHHPEDEVETHGTPRHRDEQSPLDAIWDSEKTVFERQIQVQVQNCKKWNK